uniref:Leucine rich repeat containing 26 n=1 Tax=Serinus canaria TaxID=9135 RepID=A0A8C9N870_SERCA
MRAAAGSGATPPASAARHLQPALPDTSSPRRRARPSPRARRGALGSLSVGAGSPLCPGGQPWAAGGSRPVLALLLLLRPPPSADCSERGLLGVPWSLSANTSALWLGYNFITVLGPRSFPPLPGLRLLGLAHNRLELIHPQALLGLGALQELDLSHNHLSVLTPDTFLPLTSLATLNLGSNRLGQLEPGVPGALPQLRALLLQDNPWVCSCSILPLWRWLSHNREKQLNKYPIMAFGDESFRQCQDTSLSPQQYISSFIIGPFSFMASIFFCTFLGSLVVFYHSLRAQPGPALASLGSIPALLQLPAPTCCKPDPVE